MCANRPPEGAENDSVVGNELQPAEREFLDAVLSGDRRRAAAAMRRAKLSPDLIDRRRVERPTALLCAAERGDVEMVELLLRSKPRRADVNAADARGRRCIWYACDNGDVRMAEVLLARGCQVNFVDQQTGCTPLYCCVLRNATEVCRLLVRAGANVNHRRLASDGETRTPLMEAVVQNNQDICDILVNALCDVNWRTSDGYSALHYAVIHRRYAIITLLLENGADAYGATCSGVTAMALAVAQRDAIACRTLAARDYDLDRPFNWGETALELAIKLHSETCAMALIVWGCHFRGGSDVTAPGRSGGTTAPQTPELPQPDAESHFYRAAAEGLTALVELMAAVRPRVLGERWVREHRPPLALYHKTEVLDRLEAAASSARPLVELCRAAIHGYLRRRQPDLVHRLPVSETLARYLSFSELLPPDDQNAISGPQCPYDCDSRHALRDRNCVDVEIAEDECKECRPAAVAAAGSATAPAARRTKVGPAASASSPKVGRRPRTRRTAIVAEKSQTEATNRTGQLAADGTTSTLPTDSVGSVRAS